MSFLQPILLWALPLAALPIAVHLLNIRRHRKVEWGAMMFLLQATRQRRGQRRLRHLLILLTRVVAIGALVFVISRPLAGRWINPLGGRPDTVIVVLDRSASMSQQTPQSGRSKRTVAIERIVEAIRNTGMPRTLVLVENGRREPLQVASAQALLDLPETGATDAASDIPSMLQLCHDYLVANQAGQTDIWICSDLQATDWRTDSRQWQTLRAAFGQLHQPIRFLLLSYAQRSRDNVAVRVVGMRRRSGRESDELLIDVELLCDRANPPAKIPLEVVVDGARSVLEVELTGGRARITDHVVPIDRQKTSGWGKIELPLDDNPRDNVSYFTYGGTIQNHALVVSDEPSSTWPLRLAAAPPHDPPVATVSVTGPHDLHNVRWNAISAVLWQSSLPNGDAKRQLEAYVQGGGAVLFFPTSGSSKESFMGTQWGDWVTNAAAASIQRWRDDRGLLAHSDAGDPLPVNRISVNQFRQIAGNGSVLARLGDGSPLLLEVNSDHGFVYFCATLPQRPYSNLAREGIVFYALVQRALQQGNARRLAEHFGEIDPTVRSASDVAWQTVSAWPEAGISSERPLVAGIYQAGERLIARNRPASEDTLGTVSESEIEQLWAGLNFRVVHDDVEAERSLVAEIWRLFVALLLVALIAEAALCLPDVRPKSLVVT